jgi:hypothetical protein
MCGHAKQGGRQCTEEASAGDRYTEVPVALLFIIYYDIFRIHMQCDKTVDHSNSTTLLH